MKIGKALRVIIVMSLMVSLFACAAVAADKVKVGVVGESEEVIWKPLVERLAKQGIEIELINFADYVIPNAALDAGEVDLNAFQHYAYLNNQIKDHGYKISSIGDTYISAMCVYSKKIKSLKDLKAGDKIAIPNDAVNTGRALSVLQGAGIIKLNTAADKSPELTDITDNPLKIEFVPVDAAQVPSLLPDVAAGVINGNYALDFGLSPTNDSIFYDDLNFYKDNSFVNLIAARTKDLDNEVYKKIVKAYQSEETEKIYREFFEGSYLPGWKK
ncbi:MAG: MetQ/NlpA family ABC transporter substrate-binding protein [Synergistaceae bacterium]|jgi:D-methionine transport system substrate-binding protein|nr:MetQ/NlpA family ABC transporter substrate-binding protein [Synergistaceae bacterium]